MERIKVKCNIHHQAIVDCPKCKEIYIEDLGEDDFAEGIEIDCPCGCKFELCNLGD